MTRDEAVALAQQLAAQNNEAHVVWRMEGWAPDTFALKGVTHLDQLPMNAQIVDRREPKGRAAGESMGKLPF